MDIKKVEQLLKLQQDFTGKLIQNADALRAEKTRAPEVLLKEKQHLIAQARAEVEAAAKERETAVHRWDKRVERQKKTLATLNKELAALQKQVSGKASKNSDAKAKTIKTPRSPKK